MKRHDDIATEMARLLVEVIDPAVHGPGHPLAVEAHHVGGEPISYEAARQQNYLPFTVGDPWGPAWGTTWFRLSGQVPPEWRDQEVVLRLEHAHRGGGDHRADGAHGGESLVWQDGVPRWGMSPCHPAVVMLVRAAGGEPVELLVEAAANPALPARMAGIDWPLLRADPGANPASGSPGRSWPCAGGRSMPWPPTYGWCSASPPGPPTPWWWPPPIRRWSPSALPSTRPTWPGPLPWSGST